MIPTAKEYLQNKYPSMKKHWNETDIDDNWVAQMMEDYSILKAKIYATEALKQASEKLTMKIKEDVQELDMNDDWMEVDKKSILNAYNLDEIK